jgi:hypothetical protein
MRWYARHSPDRRAGRECGFGEAVLAACGVLADGNKVLLHLAPGTKEDTAGCSEGLGE